MQEISDNPEAEANYVKRVKWHIKAAQLVASNMQTKGVAAVTSPLPYNRAMELVQLVNSS